ncbi:MAG: hypothetical protein Q9169_007104, partial [Polycauliona sp. 2 TL-2023]
MSTSPIQPDLKQASVGFLERHDSEAGLVSQLPSQAPCPKWPRILGASLNIFVLSASVSIIAILAHSLSNYSGSRGIHFGGTSISWPRDLNLHPAYFVIAASAMSIVPSLVSTIVGLRRRKAQSYSIVEKILAVLSGVLFIMWMTSVVLQAVSEKTPKKDILKWACRRRDSPTNVLVSYTSVCDEQ